MPDSDNEYELLPSSESQVDNSVNSSINTRKQSRRWFKNFRSRITGQPFLILFASVLLFAFSFGFFVFDLVHSRASTVVKQTGNALWDHFWPVGLPDQTGNWENENSKSMRALFSCMTELNCKENQTSLVLLSSLHFANAIAGSVSGEDIWAMSVFVSLRELGYTTIFAPDNYELARAYRQYPELVKVVILEGAEAYKCFESRECVKTPIHPLGIPVWKLLSFHFWTGSMHPLGNRWTLSPENYEIMAPGNSKGNVYLGYTVERTCMRIPITPTTDRPQQVYLLAKNLAYFYSDKEYAWSNVTLDGAPFTVALVAGLRDHLELGVPVGITNLGRLNQTEFYYHLGRSRVLLGIGLPFLSPSPYDALCMGVPFINPIMDWDRDFPANRTSWLSQHDALKLLDPPYVYNVFKGDGEGLWRAVKEAFEAPIERYILPSMTAGTLRQRVGEIVEKDWRNMAEQVLEERKMSGEGVVRSFLCIPDHWANLLLRGAFRDLVGIQLSKSGSG